MSLRILVIFLLTISASVKSHAWLFMEPYAGYAAGTLSETYRITAPASKVGPGASSDFHDGGIAGLKGGLRIYFIDIGGDYMAGPFIGETSSNNGGPFLQIRVMDLVKLSGTYFISCGLRKDGYEMSGTGGKAELGVRLFSWFWLNLGYIQKNFSSETVPSGAPTITEYSGTDRLFYSTLSFPINLF